MFDIRSTLDRNSHAGRVPTCDLEGRTESSPCCIVHVRGGDDVAKLAATLSTLIGGVFRPPGSIALAASDIEVHWNDCYDGARADLADFTAYEIHLDIIAKPGVPGVVADVVALLDALYQLELPYAADGDFVEQLPRPNSLGAMVLPARQESAAERKAVVVAQRQSAALATWNRRGTPWNRLFVLGQALAAVLVAVVVGLVNNLVLNLYPGSTLGKTSPSTVVASGEVTSCQREFRVTIWMVGYSWECRATVHVEKDRRMEQVTLYHSIATPDDIGHRIELREACDGPSRSRCSYGRPVSWWLSLIVTFPVWIGRVVCVSSLVLAGWLILVAVVGRPRAVRWTRRCSARRES
ncbi:hypothetical protein GCM10027290_01750 [Micromonospora sonneratiae]|uniref:DUF6346 domain-containing protein n=1 Tax=Micromonospora sonneratiae TaxID=1184706 RepID=A0ABW3Y6N0_9ACTN